MAKVFTIGEALIDFLPDRKGAALKEIESFTKAAGGAPANVACAVARLGGDSAFIGKVGADPFGQFLVETLETEGVDVSAMFRTSLANTALAFVSLKEDGDRDFSFYRNPSADMLLDASEINAGWFGEADILHFCSVDLVEAPVKHAHLKAIEAVKAAGGIVSFDPNVRLPLWSDEELCRTTIRSFLPLCDIVKISSDELVFITGIDDEREALQSLFVGDVEAVVYTKGAEGAEWHAKPYSVSVPGKRVQTADTTGAGDAFVGALLYQLQQEGLASIKGIAPQLAERMIGFANAAAALTTTRAGAISSLPKRDELLSL